MVPKVSHDKARTFVRQGRLTCPSLLYDAYADVSKSDTQKKELVQYLFSSSNRAETKISKLLYQLFNEVDPAVNICDM